MIINNNTQVTEVTSEAGGVTEVVKIIKGYKIMVAIVTSTAVSLGMYKLIVTRSRMTSRMGNCNKVIMHLQVRQMRIMKGSLLCSMC